MLSNWIQPKKNYSEDYSLFPFNSKKKAQHDIEYETHNFHCVNLLEASMI